MAQENSKIDENNKPSMLAVTDDAAAELRRVLVDPITGRLKCSAVITAYAYKTFLTVGSSNADYITDGTADDVQIQEAIDAVNTAGGGTVFIKAGTYNISATIRLKSNIKICGVGASTKLYLNNNVNAPIFLNEHAETGTEDTNIEICDMLLDGNYVNNTGNTAFNGVSHAGMGISMVDVTNSKFHDLTIQNTRGYGAIYVANITATELTRGDNMIYRNYINVVGSDPNSQANSGIWVLGRDATIIGCKIQDNIVKNIESSLGSGIRVTKGMRNVVITGNEVNTIANNGINIEGLFSPTSSLVAASLVSNNIIYNVGTDSDTSSSKGNGIYIGLNNQNIIVSNNIIKKVGGVGIYVNNTGAFFKTNVIGNNISDCGQNIDRIDSFRSGIYIDGRDVVVVGNISGDKQNIPTQQYGIYANWSGNGRILVNSNNVKDNIIAGVNTPSGTENICRNNIGYIGNALLGDTNESNKLSLKWNENDTSDRILNLLVSGADRSLTISGDSSINQNLLTTASPTFGQLTVTATTTMGGNVGIGTTAPTAVLHLKAGTIEAGTAPLKFTSGALLTTAEAGAVEFLTDAFYATITTSAVRKTFAFLESPVFTTPNIGAATGTSLSVSGKLASTASAVTVAAAATTFAVASNVVKVTGDAGANTVATITGGISGQVLILIFVDALVTITDTAAATANTVNLSAAFTGAANTTLTLVYDGNKWFETARSVNG